MSLVLNYKFDQIDLTIDSSTSNIPLVNAGGVVSSVDATYGNVASFDGSATAYFSSGTSLTQLQGSSSRTISYWVNRNAKVTFSIPYAYGDPNRSGTSQGIRTAFTAAGVFSVAYFTGTLINASTVFSVGTWYHVAETDDGTTLYMYVNGVLENSASVTINGSTDPISIGRDLVGVTDTSFIFTGFMADFRVYDDALSSANLLALIADGPNAPTLDVTMYTHLADLVWGEVSGASTYNVTFIEDSSPETALTTTSGTSFEALDLTSGSLYTFNVYTDLDLVTPEFTISANQCSIRSYHDRGFPDG